MQFKISFFFAMFFSVVVFAQSHNQLDADGKRHGYWEKRYKSGRIRYSGTFHHGKEIGTFYFYENKIINNYPAVKKIFKPNSNEVDVIFYNLYGTLLSDGQMLGKKREGLWKYYDSNGNVVLTENYKNGWLEGLRTVFFKDGKKAEESFYKNGKLHGISTRYSQQGVVLHEMAYEEGLLHGRTKFFETNGNIKETGLYYKDYKVGKWDFYIHGEYMGYKEPNKKRLHPSNTAIIKNIESKKKTTKTYPKLSDEEILANIERKREKKNEDTPLTDEEILANITKKKKGETNPRKYSKIKDDAILKNIASKMEAKIKEYKRLEDALILRNIQLKKEQEAKEKIPELSDAEIMENIQRKQKSKK